MTTRKYRSLGWFGIAVLVLSGLAVWFGALVNFKPTSNPTASTQDPETAAVMAKVLAAASAGPTQPPTHGAPVHGASMHGASIDPALLEGLPAGAAEAMAKLREFPPALEPDAPDLTGPLAARWTAEVADNRWMEFQGSMQEVFNAALASAPTQGSRLIGMECRATLCRTELELASPPAVTFIDLGGRVQQDERMASATGRYHLDGNRAVIYTAPPGTQLDEAIAMP